MLRKATLATAVCTVALLGGTTAAFAGEKTGNNKPTQGPAHSNSNCSFSGLNDQAPEEGGGGVVIPGEVQNWGHTKGTPVVISAPRGASDLVVDLGGGSFEWGCNAHLHPLK